MPQHHSQDEIRTASDACSSASREVVLETDIGTLDLARERDRSWREARSRRLRRRLDAVAAMEKAGVMLVWWSGESMVPILQVTALYVVLSPVALGALQVLTRSPSFEFSFSGLLPVLLPFLILAGIVALMVLLTLLGSAIRGLGRTFTRLLLKHAEREEIYLTDLPREFEPRVPE